jgi:hypothetical protein
MMVISGWHLVLVLYYPIIITNKDQYGRNTARILENGKIKSSFRILKNSNTEANFYFEILNFYSAKMLHMQQARASKVPFSFRSLNTRGEIESL